MVKIENEKLARVIDACQEASDKLERIEIVMKGLRGEIDEITTTLFFHYSTSNEKETTD